MPASVEHLARWLAPVFFRALSFQILPRSLHKFCSLSYKLALLCGGLEVKRFWVEGEEILCVKKGLVSLLQSERKNVSCHVKQYGLEFKLLQGIPKVIRHIFVYWSDLF